MLQGKSNAQIRRMQEEEEKERREQNKEKYQRYKELAAIMESSDEEELSESDGAQVVPEGFQAKLLKPRVEVLESSAAGTSSSRYTGYTGVKGACTDFAKILSLNPHNESVTRGDRPLAPGEIAGETEEEEVTSPKSGGSLGLPGAQPSSPSSPNSQRPLAGNAFIMDSEGPESEDLPEIKRNPSCLKNGKESDKSKTRKDSRGVSIDGKSRLHKVSYADDVSNKPLQEVQEVEAVKSGSGPGWRLLQHDVSRRIRCCRALRRLRPEACHGPQEFEGVEAAARTQGI
ncbi:hypothetical protein AK812_SmicGene12726 [Symbiodinium microadriaticum]|uniref:Uncharacterized protein n=1 Tax=Symbiodinium microadriaticum TaxID=2951 RepID=A0A1Q9E9T9_SYMMI|nr:hypothetical protein AK812_SmicGene12726 [Symbiodinium microadriaticum]